MSLAQLTRNSPPQRPPSPTPPSPRHRRRRRRAPTAKTAVEALECLQESAAIVGGDVTSSSPSLGRGRETAEEEQDAEATPTGGGDIAAIFRRCDGVSECRLPGLSTALRSPTELSPTTSTIPRARAVAAAAVGRGGEGGPLILRGGVERYHGHLLQLLACRRMAYSPPSLTSPYRSWSCRHVIRAVEVDHRRHQPVHHGLQSGLPDRVHPHHVEGLEHGADGLAQAQIVVATDRLAITPATSTPRINTTPAAPISSTSAYLMLQHAARGLLHIIAAVRWKSAKSGDSRHPSPPDPPGFKTTSTPLLSSKWHLLLQRS